MSKLWIFRTILFIGTGISLYFVPWILVKAWILPLPETVQEQVEEATNHGFVGAIVYIDKAGSSPQFYTSGLHNKEKKIPAKKAALFKIASINKLYIAVSIAKLTHAKKVDLDKTLGHYFPELIGKIAYADKISVRMLVSHRSGIPNYTDMPDYWLHPKETNAENLALVLGLPANFKPDHDYEYSNTNYLLLAELIERLLGYPHFRFIQEEILNPLNLKNTYASINEVHMDSIMSGYHLGYPHDLKTDDMGLVASAEDVGKFIRALNDGRLFEGNEQEIYTSLYEYEHKGLLPGYQSIARYEKSLNTVIVQFTNTTDPDGYYWNLAQIVNNRIVEILSNEK